MAVVYGGNKFFVKCYEKGAYAGCPAAFIIAPGNPIARLCYTMLRMILVLLQMLWYTHHANTLLARSRVLSAEVRLGGCAAYVCSTTFDKEPDFIKDGGR